MSEQEQTSQLSALFDGELPQQQAEMVIRRAVKDATMRERWQRYALIGACLRGEPLAGANRTHGVAEQVRTRLAAEAEILAPGAAAGVRAAGGRGAAGFFGRIASGGAIAAAVAVMAVMVVRSMGPAADNAGAVLTAEGPPVVVSAPQRVAYAAPAAAHGVARESAPPSYTTPGENSRAANPLVEQQPLAHYVVAHSEQAASSFGFSYDLTQGAVDMTADEIEALRR